MGRELSYLRTEDGRTYRIVASEDGQILSKAEAEVEVRPGRVLYPYETVGEFYFGELDQLWEDWARPYLEGEIESPTPPEQRRIAVQEKYDGMLFFIHRDGERVWFFTESGRDRTEIFPFLTEEARKLDARSFVLVCELVEHGEDGAPLPREQMMWTIVGKEPQPEREARIRLNVHDLLYLDGRDVHAEPYHRRVELYEDLLSGSKGPFQAAGTIYVRTRSQLERAVRAMAAVEGSEGAMLKYFDFAYPLRPGGPARAKEVAKYKSIIEVDAQVIGWYRVPKARPPEEQWSREEAERLLPELLEASRTHIYRVALRFGDRLVPVEATRRLTPGDMEFTWDEERQEWKGTDDPDRWEMCRGWPHRGPGEVAYGNTYPTAMEGVGCGTILTVAPTVVRVFDRETLEEFPVEEFDPAKFDPDRHGISWIFPKVRNLKEGGRPADVRQVLEAFRQTAVAKAAVKAARRSSLPEASSEEEEEGLDFARLTHEEQRRIAETMFGDPYMVTQPEGRTFRFVMQLHIRGIWGPQEREELLRAIREADRLEGSERREALERLFREHDVAVLVEDLQDLRRRVQRAADRQEDVAAAIARGLSTEVPDRLDLSRLVNRGNAHTDFRFETPGGNYLLGWTLDTPSAVLQFLEDGRIEYLLRHKVLEYQEGDNIVCQRKAIQPVAWLEVVTPDRPERFGEPGQLGGTKDTAGGFVLAATGKLVYGVQKSDYHEYFLFFDDPELQERAGGRWGFSLIAGGARYEDLPRAFWLANRAFAEPRPYVLTHDREEEERKGRREGVHVVWNAEGTLATLRELGYPLPEEEKEKQAQGREVPEWYADGYIWVDLYPEELFEPRSLKVFIAEGLEGAWERIGEFVEPQPDPRVPGKKLLKATQGYGFDRRLWTEETVRAFLEALGYGEKDYRLVVKQEGADVPETVCKWERTVPILKVDEERRLVLGIVAEPGVVDAQGDIMSAETIERAYYSFIRSGMVVKLMHREARPFRITQMWLAPAPMAINGYRIAKGTWLMEVEVLDDDAWRRVKAGELNGFSLHGWGRRRAIDAERLRELQAQAA